MTSVATSSGLTPFKRPRSSSSDDDDCSVKRPNYYYILAPETTTYDEEDSSEVESVYSIQGQPTDLAKDTSDTSDDKEEPGVEFEPVSSSDEQVYPFGEKDSSSSPEEVYLDKLRLKFAGGVRGKRPRSSDDSVGPKEELDEEDTKTKDSRRMFLFLTCAQCGNKNLTPLFRYCRGCYKMRKNFFPPRPKRRKTTKDESKSNPAKTESMSSESGVSSKQCETTSEGPCPTGGDMCGTCLVRPKDGGYVHKSIVHNYSCYRCSEKIFKQIGRCPICNVRVRQVCKIITV